MRGNKWGLWPPVTSPAAAACKQPGEGKIKGDNHQCLQYLSSKRLKARIACNWIGFALPASVREIKGKHRNPHRSFSFRWQARPNGSWKEFKWQKPSSSGADAAGSNNQHKNVHLWWRLISVWSLESVALYLRGAEQDFPKTWRKRFNSFKSWSADAEKPDPTKKAFPVRIMWAVTCLSASSLPAGRVRFCSGLISHLFEWISILTGT